jgi:hypothetical protein
MPIKVIPDRLQAAANDSQNIANVGVIRCAGTFWPVIKCEPSGDRLRITLTGSNRVGATYPGEGAWSTAGEGITLHTTAVGGAGATRGVITKLPATLFAEGSKESNVNLTWTLKPTTNTQLIRNPVALKLHAVVPAALITLSTRTIAVKGKSSTLTLDANVPFAQGTLKIVKGGSSIKLSHKGLPVPSLTFKAKTELQVEAREASELDGVVFEWQVIGVAGKGVETLTAVEGVLSIFDTRGVAIESKKRVVHKDRSRAKVTVTCKPAAWNGRLKLVASTDKVLLFSEPTGGKGEAASVEIAASASPSTFYVKGTKPSSAAWDTALRLSLVDLADAVDSVDLTVVKTTLTVRTPSLPKNRPGPSGNVSDFGGTGLSFPPFGTPKDAATLYCQGFPPALVRVELEPIDAPCTLVLRLDPNLTQCHLLPEVGKPANTAGPVAPCLTHAKPLQIPPGAVKAAQDKRAEASVRRYGKQGLVLWAEGLSPTTKGSPLRLDIDGVEQNCASLTLSVARPQLRIKVAREDGLDLSGDVKVTITQVSTDVSQDHVIPADQGFVDIAPDIGSYRISLEPDGADEQGFRVLLKQPTALPIDVIGPMVEAEFVLAEPYGRIQFIGYKVRTGTYKGIDTVANLSPEQKTQAQSQAKAFARAAVLDVLDLRCADLTTPDVPAEALRKKLRSLTYDQICADTTLRQHVQDLTTIALPQRYKKELAAVRRDLSRRQGVQNDIARRCQIMLDAIHTAIGDGKTKIKLGDVEDGDDVLRIFMAPEFFFRGQQGAYPVETLHEILPTLSTALDDAHFKNCLFVLGTAIGYREREAVVVGKPAASPLSTTIHVEVDPATPAGLLQDGDTGWTFLAGTDSVAIDGVHHSMNSSGLNYFQLTLNNRQFCHGQTDLAIWDPARTKVDPTGNKIGHLKLTFTKDHNLKDISNWTLKLKALAAPKGPWKRFPLSSDRLVDKRSRQITLELPTATTLGIYDTAAKITAGKWHPDHRATIAAQLFKVPFTPDPASFLSKFQPGFTLRIPGVGAFPADSVGADALQFDGAHEPTWASTANWQCGPADDKCPVNFWNDKYVELRVEFLNRDFPEEGWTFEQGAVTGKVIGVQPDAQNTATVTLEVPSDKDLKLQDPIRFLRPCFSVEIFNVAFVRKGGTLTPVSSNGSATSARLVEKELISSVDYQGPTFDDPAFYDRLEHFITLYNAQVRATPTDGTLGNREEAANPALENASDGVTETSASGLGGGSLFDMDGLSYGLEVCLDHGEGRLSKSGASPVRVQLIPSCGMSISPGAEHIDTSQHSYIFNVDGSGGGHSHSDVQDETLTDDPGTEHPSRVRNWNAVLEEAGSIVVHPVRDL